MSKAADQSLKPCANILCIEKLPCEVTRTQIAVFFEKFGYITNVYVKYRVAKDSKIFLRNPCAKLIFEHADSVDQIMASRPFYMGELKLFVRRFIPINPRYPREPFVTTGKMLIRAGSDADDDLVPDDNAIVDYLEAIDGKIEYLERLNEKTVLVQFDDYDPVDLCCLTRPHYINDRLVEIEKCIDEEKTRAQVSSRSSTAASTERSTSSTINPVDQRSAQAIEPSPSNSGDDATANIRLNYNDITSRLEHEHEKEVASLTARWEQLAKERIHFQRLKLDYQQENERYEKQNTLWQKLFSKSLLEKPLVLGESERQLREAEEKFAALKAKGSARQ